MTDADRRDHDHEHGHEHGHGHARDQGLSAAVRYLRLAPRMWRSEINEAVLEVVAPIAGERVLDIGAGMGPGMVLAAKAGATVTAVEPTPFMRRVLHGRRWFQRARSRITVADGSAERLPVPDGSIDAAWSINAMHHWVDREVAATEIARVLRPGGRVVLVDEDFEDPGHPDHERFMARHRDPSQDEDADGHGSGNETINRHGFTTVDAEEMGRLLADSGLTEIEAANQLLRNRPVISVTARR